MQIAHYLEPFDVDRRLDKLGLDEALLRAAVGRGYLAYHECTESHPRLFPPIAAWAETVCALREQLVPRGWQRSDDNNFARVVNADGTLCIIVATGNEATGLPRDVPSTKAPKGRSTVEAIVINQSQLNLFPEISVTRTSPSIIENDELLTWVLLIHRDSGETRCELSLPVQIGPEGRITEWQERIILRTIPRDVEGLDDDNNPGAPQDLDVPIRRRP